MHHYPPYSIVSQNPKLTQSKIIPNQNPPILSNHPFVMSPYSIAPHFSFTPQNARRTQSFGFSFNPIPQTTKNVNIPITQNYNHNQNLSSSKNIKMRQEFDSIYSKCLNKLAEERNVMISPSKKHFGRIKEKNQYLYEGEILNSEKNGYGILMNEDKTEIYNGEWKMNKFDGIGTLYNRNSEILEGSFDYKDFSLLKNKWKKYEGEFLEGKKNGFGTLILSNGEIFRGNFKQDLIHGEGTFVKNDGETIIGKWSENKIIMSL